MQSALKASLFVSLLVLTLHRGFACIKSADVKLPETDLMVKTERTFGAAVYEHAVIQPWNILFPTSRAHALKNMMKNLDIYQQEVEKAAAEGADIIVFPEDGIYGMILTRIALRPYLEYIPDPKRERWCPCDDPMRYRNSDVQRFLSCLARKNSIYVVANFGDLQPCDTFSDIMCPTDGYFQYNTDIVYDKQGTLVAKYHKEHLFYEFQFDKPKSTEFVYFDTPFGRFGIFTCFDILFHDPAITLIEKYNVTNIVFPTAWMDALPLLAAIQFHSAFAVGIGVNFLSANIHRPSNRFQGSGIYTPDGALSYYYDEMSKDGKLLMSQLNVLESKTRVKLKGISETGTNTLFFNSYTNQKNEFQAYVFHDLFTFVALSSTTTTINVCQQSFCCHLKYEYAELNSSEYFAFGAFSGLHTYQGKYYLEVCVLLKCASNTPHSCGSVTKESFTKFQLVNIQGNFSTDFVFPEILLISNNTLALANPGFWRYEKNSLTFHSDMWPLLSMALFGRVYEKDPTVFVA